MISEAEHDRLRRACDLIGAIYDCVLESERWEGVLDETRDLLDCANGVLSIADMPSSHIRAMKTVGIDEPWLARMSGYGAEVAEIYMAVPDMATRPLDEPFTLLRDVDRKVLEANRYVREWGLPQGIIDCIQIFVMRDARRNAALALGRHERHGPVGPGEIALLRLLAPHLRRAISIADLVDMRSLRELALGDALDALSVGIVLVSETGAVVHANQAAREMLSRRDPIMLRAGRLRALDTGAGRALMRAIRLAAGSEGGIGGHGLGLALKGRDAMSTAHVLPLAGGAARRAFAAGAVAAVFVAGAGETADIPLDPVAEGFGLTPAETRMLACLVRGQSLKEAAGVLGIAPTTAKTHLVRVLAKTDTHRQADLLALVHRLSPALKPVARKREPVSSRRQAPEQRLTAP